MVDITFNESGIPNGVRLTALRDGVFTRYSIDLLYPQPPEGGEPSIPQTVLDASKDVLRSFASQDEVTI